MPKKRRYSIILLLMLHFCIYKNIFIRGIRFDGHIAVGVMGYGALVVVRHTGAPLIGCAV